MAGMHITMVAAGKLKERFWKDAMAEYAKRLKAFCSFSVHEVADRDPKACGGEDAARLQEGADILRAAGGRHCILLAIDGRAVSSEDIAARLQSLACAGKSDVAFIIGGSTGVSDAVRARADETWSLGAITMPHNLARVVVAEQIYRAFKIARHEPYHK